MNLRAKTEVVKKLGWKPGLPDIRDHKFSVHVSKLYDAGSLPSSADVAKPINWIYNQEEESSCVFNSGASLIRHARIRLNLPEIHPSRNFGYYETRKLEGDVNQDGGAEIRDGLQIASNIGYVAESEWGYSNNTLFTSPPSKLIQEAANHRVQQYTSIEQTREGLQTALSMGFAVQFGMTVYQSMMSNEVAKTGQVPMPQGPSDQVVGGHAVLLVGYDNHSQKYRVMNSWGYDWGKYGYFYLPYQYVESTDLASDFYTINSFTDK